MTHRPIFIVGCAGAGTSLLGAQLDAHERIAIAGPTGFMRAAAAQRFVPFSAFGATWHERLSLSDEELDAALRDFYGGLFAGHAARAGKARWGERTPSHVWHLDGLTRLFADAAVVAVVRHPLGVAASNALRLEQRPRRAAAAYAAATTELLRHAARLGDRLSIVRYEDLLARPQAVLAVLLARLDEPWSERVLDPVRDPSRAARWTTALDDRARAEVAERTSVLAELLGYRLDDPQPVAELGDHGVLAGARAAARASSAPGLDLGVAPEAPLAERPLDPRVVRLSKVPPNPRSVPSSLPRATPHRGPLRRLTRHVPLPARRAALRAARRVRALR